MKRVFNVLCLSILLFSTAEMSSNEVIVLLDVEKERDCNEETLWAIDVAYDYGYDQDTVSCLGNAYYAACLGYVVDFHDCF